MHARYFSKAFLEYAIVNEIARDIVQEINSNVDNIALPIKIIEQLVEIIGSQDRQILKLKTENPTPTQLVIPFDSLPADLQQLIKAKHHETL